MKHLHNMTSISIDESRCTGCGQCIEVCPAAVLSIHCGKAVILDNDACIECGACAKNCPFDAPTVNAGVGCAKALIDGLIRFGDSEKGTCECSPNGIGGCC